MGSMTLTVLGSGVAWANPGGVCSGYLVRAADATLILDLGSGVLGRLRLHADPRAIDAVVISHMHVDHYGDLIGLRYGTLYAGFRGDRPLRVLLPPGGADRLAALGRVLDNDPRFFSGVFAIDEYSPSEPVTIGEATIRFRRVQHYIPAYAMRIENGRSLVFSGDAAPCDALVEHARDADVLLCEAAMLHRGQDEAEAAKRGHMTAGEAGEMAARAGVGRLLITHAPLDLDDPLRAAREARATFAGDLERVVDGVTYEI